MYTLLLLSLPWLSGGVNLLAVWWQYQTPLFYPWPLAVGLGLHTLAIVLYGRRRLNWKETSEKMLPSFLALAALATTLLLAEGLYLRLVLALLSGGLSLLTLKLFFLFCFDRPRYPVNALSHVNLALVPLTAFFLAWGLSGLATFVSLPWWAIIISYMPMQAALYGVTAHPTATAADRWGWTALGAYVGLQTAILIQLLPVSMLVQGAIAALLAAVPLRIRRYAYQPRPPKKLAYFEIVIASLAFLALLLLARWA